MRIARTVALAAVAAVSICAGASRAAETLSVAGTGGAMPAMEQIAKGYFAATGIRLEIVPGLGSRGGLRAAADGKLDLAVAALPLTPEESARGLSAVAFARTALVFVTSHSRPDAMTKEDIARIFASPNSKWADGSQIHLILRTKFDGDTIILQDRFAGMREAIEAARRRPEIPIAATDQDSAELAEHLAGSFVQAGLSQIVTEKRKLRFVPIDGVEPSLANFESGKYPYEKKFYLVFRPDRKAAAESLLTFIRSDKGRDILRETGNLPVAD